MLPMAIWLPLIDRSTFFGEYSYTPLVSHRETAQICEGCTYAGTWRSEKFSEMQKTAQTRRRPLGRHPGRENERRGGTRSWLQWLNRGSGYPACRQLQLATCAQLLTMQEPPNSPVSRSCLQQACISLVQLAPISLVHQAPTSLAQQASNSPVQQAPISWVQQAPISPVQQAPNSPVHHG